MNDLIDRPIRQWEEMFLPDKLAKYAEAVNYKDENGKIHKLVNESYFYYKSTRDPIPESIPLHWPRAIISGMMLGGLAVGFVLWFNYGSKFWPRTLYSYYTLILGVIIGGPGMYLASGIFFTDHEVAFYNENLLLVNPLTFLFIYLGLELQKNKAVIWKWQRWNWSLHLALLTSAALLKFLPSFDQDNTLIFAFLTPIYVLNTLAVWMISD